MRFCLDDAQARFCAELAGYLDGLDTTGVVDGFEVDFTQITGRAREFVRRLGRDGWLGVGWPAEYGGQGRSALEQWLFLEEMAYRRLPTGNLTVSSIGPVLARLGTEEQKRHYLPGILAGELDFAIGYTEPDAGSDLASLSTRADRSGGGYVIRGQKVYTTGAHIATHLWLAARTGPPDSRHRGLSLFIIPMDTPGITVHRLVTQGDERTNEVFLDNVAVPVDARVGEENCGWEAITLQLDFERLFACSLLRWQYEQVVRSGAGAAGGEAAHRREALARLGAELEAVRLLTLQAAWMIDAGETPYAEASMAKVAYSELRQRLAQQAMALQGTAGQVRYGEPGALGGGYFERAWRSSPTFKFGAGTNEVQRNIIAQRGLGLPR